MSNLVQGNKALRDKDYQQAIVFYIEALMVNPELAKVITPNIAMAKQKRNVEREKNKERQKVAVCGWELSDDTAERVYTLAKLYESFAEVEIIGTLFPEYGGHIRESIRLSSIAVHSFMVNDEGVFLEQALKLVLEHPYDVVHLSQPRITNIFFGLLYKLIWDAKVLVDVVDAGSGISVDDYLEAEGSLPELKDLNGVDWTRLAFGLVDEFDAVTVSDVSLQKQYGGGIINKLPLELMAIMQKIINKTNQNVFQKILSVLTPFHSIKHIFYLINLNTTKELTTNSIKGKNKEIIIDYKNINFKEVDILIKNFNLESFLNKEIMNNIELKIAIKYFLNIGYKNIHAGVSKFHKNYAPYDEKLYLKIFPDIAKCLEDKVFCTGFEHFCLYGYKEIIEDTRKYPLSIKNNPIELLRYINFKTWEYKE